MKPTTPLMAALLLLAGSLPTFGQSGQKSTGTSTDRSNILQEYDDAIDQVAEKAMHSVVEIEVTGFGKPESDDNGEDQQTLQRQRAIGSGVIVDPDGYIVTNNHVVAGALRIRVIVAPATVELLMGHTQFANQQRIYEAKLIGTNRYADLAVIKIEAHGFRPVTDGKCVGEDLAALMLFGAESFAKTELLTSGFVTVHLSSNPEVPAAGAETTCPVEGSTSVSGIGSFNGLPLISVP